MLKSRVIDSNKSTGQNIQQFGQHLIGQMKGLKNKFDQMDEQKKKKLIAGIAGVAALLAGVHAAKKSAQRKRAHKK